MAISQDGETLKEFFSKLRFFNFPTSKHCSSASFYTRKLEKVSDWFLDGLMTFLMLVLILCLNHTLTLIIYLSVLVQSMNLKNAYHYWSIE